MHQFYLHLLKLNFELWTLTCGFWNVRLLQLNETRYILKPSILLGRLCRCNDCKMDQYWIRNIISSRVEIKWRNRRKRSCFLSNIVDFVGFLFRKCRLPSFLSVLSVFDVRSVDYRRFLSVLSVSICFQYKRSGVKLSDWWCRWRRRWIVK